MSERDAVWALQQYEAIRSVLPVAHMPKKSVHAENLGEIGDLFDAEIHEAITQIPASKEKDKGKIIDIIEAGYQLGEKIIRYPKVVVGQ